MAVALVAHAATAVVLSMVKHWRAAHARAHAALAASGKQHAMLSGKQAGLSDMACLAHTASQKAMAMQY